MSRGQFGPQSFPSRQQSSFEILPSLVVLVHWEFQAGVAEIGAGFAGRCWRAGGAGTRRSVASDLSLALQHHVQWRAPFLPKVVNGLVEWA